MMVQKRRAGEALSWWLSVRISAAGVWYRDRDLRIEKMSEATEVKEIVWDGSEVKEVEGVGQSNSNTKRMSRKRRSTEADVVG